MKTITQEDFTSLVTDNDLVVLKFSAPWCGPCRALTPMMNNLSQDFSQISFAEVDVDASPNLAAQFNVRNVPTVVGFKKGEIQWVKVGLPTPQDLRQSLQSLQSAV